ncbi:hypothetical protein CSA37_01725 [Candidatus Fermentibacteria bacterium]|nr:MAG: hypothetical protein CSA37_01725 [Candidatus Fermentibacteria bacterium]
MKKIRRVALRSSSPDSCAETIIEAGLQLVDNPAEADAVVVAGGDGTILRYMNELLPVKRPVLAVNAGHLGFLADCELESMADALGIIREGLYSISELPVIEADCGGSTARALNDICINRCPEGGILHITVSVDGGQVASIASDGVLVSTPSGSTAYNLSCGGPILHPNLPAVIINAICPHLLAIRPIVVPLSSVVKFTVTRAREKAPLILADGVSRCGSLEAGDSITVRDSGLRCPVIRTGESGDHYTVLGCKLGWGFRG